MKAETPSEAEFFIMGAQFMLTIGENKEHGVTVLDSQKQALNRLLLEREREAKNASNHD